MQRAGLVVEYAGFSDKGCVRKINEDDFFISERHHVFAVADGVGGLSGGEIASALALKSIESSLEILPRRTLASLLQNREANEEDQLKGFIESANLQVYNSSQEQYRKYATTLILLALGDNRITIGHVGDSRAYCYRDGELNQLTTDHTVAQELSGRTKIGADSPYHNIITRAVGVGPMVTIDFLQKRLQPGDTVLLCSDGLTSMLSSEAIEGILAPVQSVRRIGLCLVEQAKSAGGRDNITVVLIRCSGERK